MGSLQVLALVAAAFAVYGLTRAGKVKVGAWAYPMAITKPAAYIARCKASGTRHIDIMVNGNDVVAWHCQPFDAIRAAVATYRAAGIKVSLTSWARPRQDWVDGIGELAALCEELGVGLTLDLEGPWLTALEDLPDAVIEQWTAALFDAIEARYSGDHAITIIVWASSRVIRPAVRRAKVVIPQAYSSKNNTKGMKPGDLQRQAVQRMRALGARRIVMGLDGWDVYGYGLTDAESMRADLVATVALGIHEVRFWHLDSLHSERAAIAKEFAA